MWDSLVIPEVSATLISSYKGFLFKNISGRWTAVCTVAEAGLTLCLDIFWSTFIPAVCGCAGRAVEINRCAVIPSSPFSSPLIQWNVSADCSRSQSHSDLPFQHTPASDHDLSLHYILEKRFRCKIENGLWACKSDCKLRTWSRTVEQDQCSVTVSILKSLSVGARYVA